LLPQIIVGIKVENVGHQVQSILVVGNLSVQAREVESVCQVILIDFAEVFISPRRDKLNDKRWQISGVLKSQDYDAIFQLLCNIIVLAGSMDIHRDAENPLSSHILKEQLATRQIHVQTVLRGWRKTHRAISKRGSTYPVSPVACVITISLAVEVLHHVDHRVCRDVIRSGCFLVFGGWVGGSAEIRVDQPRGAGSPDCDTAGQFRRCFIPRQAEIHGRSSVDEGGGG
jgi:hypothetical protein